MATQTLARPREARSDTDSPVHVACECTPNTALCGHDVSGQPWDPPEIPTTCVVCADLEPRPCERCGG